MNDVPCLSCAILMADGFGWLHDECAVQRWPSYGSWVLGHPIPPEGARRDLWRRRLDAMLGAVDRTGGSATAYAWLGPYVQ